MAKASFSPAPQKKPAHLLFDGVDDTTSFSDHDGMDNLYLGDFTVEVVMSMSSGVQDPHYWGCDVFSKYPFGTYFPGLTIWNENSQQFGCRLQAYVYEDDGATYFGSDSQDIVPDNTPHHFAIVFRKSTSVFRIYMDGVDITKESSVTDGLTFNYPDDSGIPFLFVQSWIAGGVFYKGQLHWGRVSNTARYTSNFTPPSLKICPANDAYTMFRLALDDGTGTVAKDTSRNHNNGTIVGATWELD